MEAAHNSRRTNDEPLGRYEGLHVLHLGTADLEPVRSRLQGSGLHPSEIRAFQRLVDTPDGSRMMRARSLSFPRGSNRRHSCRLRNMRRLNWSCSRVI